MNILPVYGVVMDSFGPFGGIVTPWCMNGNAVQYLHKYNLSPLERYRLWRGVVDGLVYLHSYEPQIIHGDVKPPNILIADDGRPMICDLGLTRLVVSHLSPTDAGTTVVANGWVGSILQAHIRVHRDTSRLSKSISIVRLNRPRRRTCTL